MSSSSVTRRAALFGATASALALAVPASAALEPQPRITAELGAILDRYEAATVARDKAEQDVRQMEDEFQRRLAAADLRVRLSGKRGLPDYRRLDRNTWPAEVRDQIREQFSVRLSRALCREREGNPMRAVLQSSGEVRAEWGEVNSAAAPLFARFNRIKREVQWDALQDACGEAYSEWAEAKAALLSYRPASLVDLQAIAVCLERTAERTRRWHDIPSQQFLRMVVEIEVAA